MTLWTIVHRVPLSTGFSRKEYWSGLPCPPPGDLPNPGIKATSLTCPALAGGFFTSSTTWEAHSNVYPYLKLYLFSVITNLAACKNTLSRHFVLKLICPAGLVSGVRHSNPVTHTHASIRFQVLPYVGYYRAASRVLC